MLPRLAPLSPVVRGADLSDLLYAHDLINTLTTHRPIGVTPRVIRFNGGGGPYNLDIPILHLIEDVEHTERVLKANFEVGNTYQVHGLFGYGYFTDELETPALTDSLSSTDIGFSMPAGTVGIIEPESAFAEVVYWAEEGQDVVRGANYTQPLGWDAGTRISLIEHTPILAGLSQQIAVRYHQWSNREAFDDDFQLVTESMRERLSSFDWNPEIHLPDQFSRFELSPLPDTDPSDSVPPTIVVHERPLTIDFINQVLATIFAGAGITIDRTELGQITVISGGAPAARGVATFVGSSTYDAPTATITFIPGVGVAGRINSLDVFYFLAPSTLSADVSGRALRMATPHFSGPLLDIDGNPVTAAVLADNRLYGGILDSHANFRLHELLPLTVLPRGTSMNTTLRWDNRDGRWEVTSPVTTIHVVLVRDLADATLSAAMLDALNNGRTSYPLSPASGGYADSFAAILASNSAGTTIGPDPRGLDPMPTAGDLVEPSRIARRAQPSRMFGGREIPCPTL